MRELVRLTNQEIGKAKSDYKAQLKILDGQLTDSRKRLHKLYNALETGKLGVEDLAPRIKKLKTQINELEVRRFKLNEEIQVAKEDFVELSTVMDYVKDLNALLSQGSIIEQRSFLQSFVKRIEVSPPNILIDYTIPIKMKKVEPFIQEVLPIALSSSGGRT